MRTLEVDSGKLRPPAPHRDGGALKYRLDVVAASSADVVCSVGGWLYDRVLAGWEVTVTTVLTELAMKHSPCARW